MTLGLLALIIIGVILLILANVYSVKEIIAYPLTNDTLVAITFFIDLILFVIGFISFLDWSFTIKLW